MFRTSGGRRRLRDVVVASAILALLVTPLAVAQSTGGSSVNGGQRNPSNNTSAGYTKETQIVGNIAQNQGGVAANTGGFTTRQSNKSDSGGGAIYGCRAKAGSEACVAANNLNNGDAFRFQTTEAAGAVGQLRFGLDINKAVDKPPLVTNGTGLVKNLNADRVDGKSADEFVGTASLPFAVVGADGAIAANRGVPAGGKATVATTGGNEVFTVPFADDISKCAYTATPTDPNAPTLAVSTGADNKSVVVTEKGTTPFGFHLQVTC
jgi:hypothetical protein